MKRLVTMICLSLALCAAPGLLHADDPPSTPDVDTGGGGKKQKKVKKKGKKAGGEGSQDGGTTSTKTTGKTKPKSGSGTVKTEGAGAVVR